jgi:hypothetical protein
LFDALADCLQTVVPTDRFGIVLPSKGDQLQGCILTQRDVRSESLQSTIFSPKGTAAEWVLQNREWYVAAAQDEMRDRFPATERVMQEAEMQSLCELPGSSGSTRQPRAIIASTVALFIFGIPAAIQQHKHSTILRGAHTHTHVDWMRVGIVGLILVLAIGTNVIPR